MENNKKIGIVTLYQGNFGSILQLYSTYNYIKKFGFEPYLVINNNHDDLSIKLIRNLKRAIRHPSYLLYILKGNIAGKENRNLLSLQTRDKMNDFIKTEYRIVKDFKEEDFCFFIAGSDQIWNGYSAFYFLNFTSKDKRIAFAPSFGSKNVQKYWENEVAIGLEGFNVLSVREESGVKIIKDLTGKDAVRLADPTILLDREEWRSFAQKGMQESGYILLHFLNEPSKLSLKKIEEYLCKNNCRVYAIYSNYGIEGWNFIDINPYDYVSLINNADAVFTDSFHSTLFSLNLETQFYTFERNYLHGNSQSSRITDLLKRIGMIDRYITGDELPKGNWNSDEIFKEDRKNIRDYLKKAIGK